MPNGRRRSGSAVRTIAPAIPLAIALLHGAVTSNQSLSAAGHLSAETAVDRAHELAENASAASTHQCENISNAQQCHTTYPEGCTDSARPNTYDAYLSYLKNVLPTPQSSEAKVAATLRTLDDFQAFDQKSIALELGKQKQKNFANELAEIGQGNIYQAVGYIYYAIPGGVETCNCKLKRPDDKDFHIGLGFDQNVATSIANGDIKNRGNDIDPVVQQTSIIVEMTPFYRAKFHQSWTLSKVQKLEGKQVKVIGQLIVDNEHNTADQNCAFQDHGEECWRGSAWELHPVTSVYVCTTRACSADSTGGWISLDLIDN
jgi:hypothetical protein